jgi:hypothetical protein
VGCVLGGSVCEAQMTHVGLGYLVPSWLAQYSAYEMSLLLPCCRF